MSLGRIDIGIFLSFHCRRRQSSSWVVVSKQFAPQKVLSQPEVVKLLDARIPKDIICCAEDLTAYKNAKRDRPPNWGLYPEFILCSPPYTSPRSLV